MYKYTGSSSIMMTLDEALEINSVGLFQYRLLFLCGFAFMADALEVSLLTFMATCAGVEWGLSKEQEAAISGIVFAGILVGSLFWGIVADRYGRKTTLMWVYFIIVLFGVLSGLAPNYVYLIIFRALVGFGIGGANVPFDLLAEFLPTSHRGTFLVYIEYFWSIGSLFVAGLAWTFLSSHGWRFLTLLTAVPVTITSLVSIAYLPESPRWLLVKGRKTDAEKVVRDAALVNGIHMLPFTLSSESCDWSSMSECDDVPLQSVDKMEEVKEFSYLDLLKIKEIRNISIPLWTLWTIFGFTYYGIIIFVSRLYSYNANKDSQLCSFDYQSIFLNASAELAGVFLSAILIDRCGRINTQFLFYCIAGFSVFFMGFSLDGYSLLAVSGIARMSIMASSNVTWVSTPELYTTEVRAMGHSVCVAFSKIGAFLCPFIIASGLSNFNIGSILGLLNIIAAFIVFSLPETTGKMLKITKENSQYYYID